MADRTTQAPWPSTAGAGQPTADSARFNLLRFFTTASLIVIVVASLGAGIAAALVVQHSFFKMEEDEADSLAEDLVGMMQSFDYGPAQWGRAAPPPELSREVDRELENFDIVEFTVFNLGGSLLTDFGSGTSPSAAFWPEGHAAARAGAVHLRWERSTWWSKALFARTTRGAIETYAPIRHGGAVVAVARVRRNLSPVLSDALGLLPWLAGLAALVGCVVFGALWVIVRKADRILASQNHEIVLAQRELERRNQTLAELNRRKDEFYAICSHDLRSPLLSLHAGCKLLLTDRRRPLDAPQREILEESIRGAGHALHLVDDLLDLARIEAGAEELEAAPLDLVEVVEEVVAAARPLAVSRGVTLNVQSPPAPLSVPADRFKLLRVFGNLLSNAIKHSPGDAVTVTVAATDRGASVSVADRGPGIPLEQQACLFDRFSDLSRGKRTRDAGTGLGLSIVRELVELHGGTVSVVSDAGHGATFTVNLPNPP